MQYNVNLQDSSKINKDALHSTTVREFLLLMPVLRMHTRQNNLGIQFTDTLLISVNFRICLNGCLWRGQAVS